MNIIIKINCDSEAIEQNGLSEIKRILNHLLDTPEWETISQLDGKKLRDYNGNTVGEVEVEL